MIPESWHPARQFAGAACFLQSRLVAHVAGASQSQPGRDPVVVCRASAQASSRLRPSPPRSRLSASNSIPGAPAPLPASAPPHAPRAPFPAVNRGIDGNPAISAWECFHRSHDARSRWGPKVDQNHVTEAVASLRASPCIEAGKARPFGLLVLTCGNGEFLASVSSSVRGRFGSPPHPRSMLPTHPSVKRSGKRSQRKI